MYSALHLTDGHPRTRSHRCDLQMTDLLGSGSSGTVFRAEHRTTAGLNLVAVKIPHRTSDLRKEASTLRRFGHPNIVSLIDAPDNSNEPLIVELCDGGTIEELLAVRPLTVKEVRSLVAAIGAALSTLHEYGWIHGDVTPSNIGLRTGRQACLFDFGSARRVDGSNLFEGTREFCGDSLTSVTEVDVRSLAATARSCLSPVNSELAHNLEKFIAHCDAGKPASIDDLVTVCNTATHDDPLFPSQPDVAMTPSSELTTPARVTGGPGEPPRPRTSEFGPRPEPARQHLEVHSPEIGKGPRVAIAVLAATLAILALTLFPRSSNNDQPLATQSLHERFSASHSLEANAASWSDDGVISVDLNGSTRTFAAGQPGDHAAVADWTCDGTATLGVYRPSTGAWFTFDSWSVNAVSTVHRLEASQSPFTELVVDIDETGCARPVLG